MVHGSKCETQRVSRFSSQKHSSTAHAYVYVFITAKTKIAGPTRPHSVSSHFRDYYALYALNVFSLQGHPATVFCKISVRRRKYCLEFSFASGRLKISR